jgi:hypothetical protein
MLMRAREPIASRPCLTEAGRTGEFTESFGHAVRRNARRIARGLGPGRARSFSPNLASVIGELGPGRRDSPNTGFALDPPAAGLRDLFRPPEAASATTLLRAWGGKG